MQKYLIPRCHLVVKKPSANTGDIRDTSSIPASGRSRGGARAIPSSILAWRIHGQRSLAGYNSWGCEELDMTEVTWHTRTQCKNI